MYNRRLAQRGFLNAIRNNNDIALLANLVATTSVDFLMSVPEFGADSLVSPLMLAIELRNPDLVEQLLKKNADPNLICFGDVVGSSGNGYISPLLRCAQHAQQNPQDETWGRIYNTLVRHQAKIMGAVGLGRPNINSGNMGMDLVDAWESDLQDQYTVDIRATIKRLNHHYENSCQAERLRAVVTSEKTEGCSSKRTSKL